MSKPKADATIKHDYHSAYNAIVEPSRYVALSLYYVTHWLPVLGENGHRIVTVLRSQGFLNLKTGDKREGIDIEQAQLAALCGMSLRTLQREFGPISATDARPKNPALHQFVQREFRQERNAAGRIVREHYLYVVKMDEPLIEADKARLQKTLEAREKQNQEPENPVQQPTRQNDTSAVEPKRQNGGSGRQNDAPKRQNDVPTRQNGGSYIESLITLTTENTSLTAALPGFLPSAVSGTEKLGVVPVWANLTEGERQSYRGEADAELSALHPEGEWEKVKHKERLVETRAKTLFTKVVLQAKAQDG